MDKQKQIEDKKQLIEILKNSKDIVSYQPNAYKLLTLNGNDKKFFATSNDGNVTIHFDKVVDEIYTQGYRKIPESSVVLSKEEYEILTDISTLKNKVQEALNTNPIEELIQVEREARKQAIKDFIQAIKKDANVTYYNDEVSTFAYVDIDDMYFIARDKFGVEVEE